MRALLLLMRHADHVAAQARAESERASETAMAQLEATFLANDPARMTARARSLSVPMTTRSGRIKSPIAEPSRRNSGFEQMSNAACGRHFWIISDTSRPVPTGTVDLVTITA